MKKKTKKKILAIGMPLLLVLIAVILFFIIKGCSETKSTEAEEEEEETTTKTGELPECGEVEDMGLCEEGKCTCPQEGWQPVVIDGFFGDTCICE